MYKMTHNGLIREGLIAGLKLFGLPNLNRSYDAVMEEAKIHTIKLSGVKKVKGSGLLWDQCYDIVHEPVSKRIEEELEAALENFLLIGDFEYVFYPNQPEKELDDWSSDRVILLEECRDIDGKVYTVEGEGCRINILTIDIDYEEALVMFDKYATEYLEKEWYGPEQLNEITDNTDLWYKKGGDTNGTR